MHSCTGSHSDVRAYLIIKQLKESLQKEDLPALLLVVLLGSCSRDLEISIQVLSFIPDLAEKRGRSRECGLLVLEDLINVACKPFSQVSEQSGLHSQTDEK